MKDNKIGSHIGCFTSGLGFGISFTMGEMGFLIGLVSIVSGVIIVAIEAMQSSF